MTAIYKRELKSYFNSMIGYVIIAFMIAFAGIYFMVYNLNMGYPYFSLTLSSITIVHLFVVPIITMKCFAEERKSKTDQLLLTSPVSLFEIVAGKYLAMVTVYLIPNVIFCLFPLIIKLEGESHLLADYTSIAVFFLLGCVYIAIGMFISALTESQIIAAIGTFGILLIFNLWSGLTQFLPKSAIGGAIGIFIILSVIAFFIYQLTKNWFISTVIEVVGIITLVIAYLVKSSVFDNLLNKLFGKIIPSEVLMNVASNQVLDIGGLISFVTIIAMFLFLSMQMIQKRRWS